MFGGDVMQSRLKSKLQFASAISSSVDGKTLLKKVAKMSRNASTGTEFTDETPSGLQSTIIQHLNTEQDRSGISMTPFIPGRWNVKRFQDAIIQEHEVALSALLFEAKTILKNKLAQANELALSGAGDSPTANVTPTAEETR